jgi:hypothetical protein
MSTEDSKLKNKFHAWYEGKVSHLFFNSLVMTVINWQLCIIPKQGGKCEDLWKSFHSSNSLKGSYPYTCHKGTQGVEV